MTRGSTMIRPYSVRPGVTVFDRRTQRSFTVASVTRVSGTAVRIVTTDGVIRVFPTVYQDFEVQS